MFLQTRKGRTHVFAGLPKFQFFLNLRVGIFKKILITKCLLVRAPPYFQGCAKQILHETKRENNSFGITFENITSNYYCILSIHTPINSIMFLFDVINWQRDNEKRYYRALQNYFSIF